jgi:hypothetical protein
MRSKRCLGALTVFLLWAPSFAWAGVLYQYDGNPFQSVAGRYTTSDSLSGTIEVASVLAPNLTNAAITLTDWSFSDGLKVFDATNSTSNSPMVSTDGVGRIVSWSIDFSNAQGAVMGTFNNGPVDQIDQATDFTDGNSLASNMNLPGNWRLVPEPSSGALGALSLTLLLGAHFWISRRRLLAD